MLNKHPDDAELRELLNAPAPEGSRLWLVRQVVKDPEDDCAFSFVGLVDLDASDSAGEVRLRALRIDY